VKLTDPLTGKPVYFDGCRESDGVMLEAKGFSYENFITRAWNWQVWFKKLPDIESQAIRQSRAAGSRGVEWHIADPDAAIAFEMTIRRLGIKNIKVVYDPPSARKVAIADYWIFAP
jgi:Restriction endonuclease fold toxin 5